MYKRNVKLRVISKGLFIYNPLQESGPLETVT